MAVDRVAELRRRSERVVPRRRRRARTACGCAARARNGRRRRDRPFNQLVLAAPDGTMHRYAKIHPFGYGAEPEHYAAGDAFLTVDVEGVRCSFFVCYDLRFADEFWPLAPGHRLLRGGRELAAAAARALVGAAARPRDREPGVRGGRQPRRHRRRAHLRGRLGDPRSARRAGRRGRRRRVRDQRRGRRRRGCVRCGRSTRSWRRPRADAATRICGGRARRENVFYLPRRPKDPA